MLLEAPRILSGEPILSSPLDLDSFPFAFVVYFGETSQLAGQPQAPEEQPITGAYSRMDMGHLPIAEEVPTGDFPLSADRIKSVQENLSECQKFLAVSILVYRVLIGAIDWLVDVLHCMLELAKYDAAMSQELEKSKTEEA